MGEGLFAWACYWSLGLNDTAPVQSFITKYAFLIAVYDLRARSSKVQCLLQAITNYHRTLPSLAPVSVMVTVMMMLIA